MKKLILFTAISCSIFAANSHNLVLDPYLSPYIGADDLIMAHQLLEEGPLSKIGKPLSSRTSVLQKVARCSELFFLWDPINYMSMVTQHEVFGHGYRVRSLRNTGAEVTKYKIGVPPPYGRGGGLTGYRYYPSKTSVFQMSSVASAGVESTAILANRLRLQWLKEQKIPHAQASLYQCSQQDITRYIFVTQEFDNGDMSRYAQLLGRTYGEKLRIRELKNRAYMNLLDPFTFYSLYSSWKYIFQGSEASIPMIPIGSYKYLPSFRMGLTPFGPEYYLENFLVKDNSPIYFYVRSGSFARHQYTGAGIEYPYLWRRGTLSLGFRADAWLQPAANFNDSRYSMDEFISSDWTPVREKGSRLGASISLICQKEMWENGSFFLQAGGKSQGYLPGEELSSGLIFRVGLTLW